MKPKFILSKSVVLDQYKKLKPIADIVSYSSKTNPLLTPILEEETKCLFSIHMVNELKHVKDKSRVLFLAQAWDDKQITSLLDQGVKWFAVDNVADLDTILNYIKDKDVKINLLLRLKLKENSLKTERYYVFGMPSSVIEKKIQEIQENFRNNIDSLGLHFHRKTQNMSEWNYKYELSHLFSEETFKALDVINIGGGLPSEYANTNVKVIESVINKIKELNQWLKSYNIQTMIEPGRFIAAPSIELHTTVIGIHENTIIVNASVYNVDMDALIVPVKLKVKGELAKGESDPFIIKGITPCSLDLFRYRVYLDKPAIGDQLIFLNAGAYNFTTEFCDLDKIPTVVD